MNISRINRSYSLPTSIFYRNLIKLENPGPNMNVITSKYCSLQGRRLHRLGLWNWIRFIHWKIGHLFTKSLISHLPRHRSIMHQCILDCRLHVPENRTWHDLLTSQMSSPHATYQTRTRFVTHYSCWSMNVWLVLAIIAFSWNVIVSAWFNWLAHNFFGAIAFLTSW